VTHIKISYRTDLTEPSKGLPEYRQAFLQKLKKVRDKNLVKDKIKINNLIV